MTHGPPTALSRRSLLLASAGAVLLGGCTSGGGPSPSAGTPGPAPTSVDPTSPPREPTDVAPYEVLAGEVEPACKLAAVRALEAALTWREGDSGVDAARRRLTELGAADDAVAPLERLLGDDPWSSLQVTYPQYGGLLTDLTEASVMIVCEQVTPGDTWPVRRSVTVDARLAQGRSGWRVSELRLDDPPEPAAQLTDAARTLLEHDRVVLPEAARWDVESGLVDDLVLSMLSRLGEQWRIDVHVLSSGHPYHVFGTDRQSNHTRGRAVDVWALDGIPVIDQERAPWREVMEAAAAIGADEIGGPEDLDGVRGQRPYFSDHVHQDHLHLGFEPPRDPAGE